MLGSSSKTRLEVEAVINLSGGSALRILVVEDTEDVGEAVVSALERAGHAVDWQRTLAGTEDALAVQDYSLIVLDINLPDGSGFDILARLRKRGTATPVLVLTARALVDDRVDALDTGADDYLVKPFDFRELEARARALLRRRDSSFAPVLSVGDITFDRSARLVRLDGRQIDLTRREMALLEVLMGQQGRVFSKTDLLDQLYGFEGDAGPNAIELYVGRLRKKLAGANAEIRTLRGVGYQIVALNAAVQ